MMKSFLRYVATFSLGCFVFSSWARAEMSQPNIIFILVDDMGWTGLSRPVDAKNPDSCSDFYQTPHLDKLAKRGMYFSNAYAPAPMCSPSRASILTGKSPAQLHMTSPGRGGKAQDWQKIVPPKHVTDLPEAEITLPEILKKKGYATAHFGKWHLNGGGPGNHGFDVHDGDTGNDAPDSELNPKDIFGITQRARTFMRTQVKAETPFYVQLSHYAVHQPVAALASTKEECAARPHGKYHQNVDYAAMTQDFDRSVGMLLQEVKELGIGKDTYVIFTSDNGAGSRPGSQENAPLAGGKASLWEGGIRVPMIVVGPKIPSDVCRDEVVIGSDLLPTICEIIGVKKSLPKGVEGVSLWPLFTSKDGKIKRSQNALVFHFPHYGRGPKQLPQSAIRVGDKKLLYDYESGSAKLFDLSTDLGEAKDLSGTHPEKTAKMKLMLIDYLKKIKAQLPTKNPSYSKDATSTQRQGGRENGGRRDGKKGFVGRFDTNNDGKVSRDEFTGPMPRFKMLDENDDGVISGDEVPQGRPK